MNMYLDELLVRDRLDDARLKAARRATVRSLRPARWPVRVSLGLALVRAGLWIAGRAAVRAEQAGRAIA
jgi:hypothetical protein